MSRKDDATKEYAKARVYQTALGAVVCALGLGALYLGHTEIALALVAMGGKLMPTGMLIGPKP